MPRNPRTRLNHRFNPMKLIVILAIIAIPAIYGGILTSANYDPTHKIDQVPAALVNHDTPVTIDGAETNLGAELTDKLINSDATNNFAWETTDADTAQHGLENGTYQAVLTIPEGFSAAATSTGNEDPATAQAAQLTITTNDGANIISGNIASTLGTSLADDLAEQVSKEYLTTVYSGLNTISDQMNQAAEGASSLAEGANTAADGTHSARDGATELANGAATLAEGTENLATGSQQLADSASALAENYAAMTDEQRQQALTQLAGSASALAEGATSVDNGADQLSTGLTTLVGGEDSGLTQLANGMDQLAGNSSTLATSLTDGANSIPTYTDQESAHLSQAAASPVTAQTTRINEVSTYGHGLAPYFMSLSLWVGAIAHFLMFPAIHSRLGHRNVTGIRALLGSLTPVILMALAQGTVLALVMHTWIGITMANFGGLWALSILTSLTFLAINQALIALLDAPGRFLALLLAVFQLAAAGGTYPIETAPSFFQAIHSWLPLTHALEGFRSLIAGGTLGITEAYWYLTIWGTIAVAGTALSIWIRHHNEGRHSKAEQTVTT